MQSRKSVEILPILKRSLSLYKDNFSLFIKIAILGEAVYLLDMIRRTLPQDVLPWTGFIVLPAGILVYTWASIALVIAASNRYADKTIVLKESFVQVKGKYWRYICVGILYLLILGTGLLLFLIPGIYWGTIFSLAGLVVVLEKRRDISPFKISKILVRGNFWKVFFLGLIMLVLSLPPLFLLRTARINENLAIIVGRVFYIFLGPFSTSVSVTLYHVLRDRKESELAVVPEARVKRGKGCLGCLGTVGLVISIIVLSVCWGSGLMKFSRTERGSQISEYIKETISQQITFRQGPTLERPKGWLVIEGRAPKRYNLFRFENKEIKGLKLYCIATEDLNISKSLLTLDNQLLGDRIWEQNIKGSAIVQKLFQRYEPKAVNVIKLGDRCWAEYTLEEVQETKYATVIHISKNVYTIFDGHVLVGSYGYCYRTKEAGETVKLGRDLLTEEEQIQSILMSLKFPTLGSSRLQ